MRLVWKLSSSSGWVLSSGRTVLPASLPRRIESLCLLSLARSCAAGLLSGVCRRSCRSGTSAAFYYSFICLLRVISDTGGERQNACWTRAPRQRVPVSSPDLPTWADLPVLPSRRLPRHLCLNHRPPLRPSASLSGVARRTRTSCPRRMSPRLRRISSTGRSCAPGRTNGIGSVRE